MCSARRLVVQKQGLEWLVAASRVASLEVELTNCRSVDKCRGCAKQAPVQTSIVDAGGALDTAQKRKDDHSRVWGRQMTRRSWRGNGGNRRRGVSGPSPWSDSPERWWENCDGRFGAAAESAVRVGRAETAGRPNRSAKRAPSVPRWLVG
ncbi:hypothetical protein GGTG_12996 [Gaeumannomyces tritici R3-111a-1]|uniref:Uncharacterized protein n=1 Tax=Gaeumannomyces tritici (strain R3-111a-1) TaxID=644352 RepID=J3PHL6_GAET3|nr:hypothetical protein GGTG_12996 [Gaeumannomyces tritici R3-111a-1]EJT69377.1 hypothetical protein GGTG_12996 [Gaeumannomyces tritici R3-111a-1]